MDVLGQGSRLLEAVGFEVAIPTAAEWVEALFKGTDGLTRAACTRLLRFAADAAQEVRPSPLTPASAVAINT